MSGGPALPNPAPALPPHSFEDQVSNWELTLLTTLVLRGVKLRTLQGLEALPEVPVAKLGKEGWGR